MAVEAGAPCIGDGQLPKADWGYGTPVPVPYPHRRNHAPAQPA